MGSTPNSNLAKPSLTPARVGGRVEARVGRSGTSSGQIISLGLQACIIIKLDNEIQGLGLIISTLEVPSLTF